MTAAPTQEKSIIGVGWIDPKFSFEGDHFIYSFREGGAHSSTAYRQYFENDSLMTTFDTLSLDTIDKLLLDLSKSSILESIFEAKEEIQGESNEQVVSLQLPTLNLYQLFKSLFIASFRLVLDSLDGQVTTNNEESKKFTENLSNTFPSDRQVLLENWTPFSNILYPLTIAFIYSKGGCQKPKIAKWELSDYYCPETMMTDSPPLQLYYKCPISKLLRWMQLKDKSFSIEAEQYLHFFLTEPQYNILFPPDEASNTSPNVGSCFETTSLFSLTFTVESLIQLLENGFQNLEIYKKLYCANIFPLNTLSDGSINSKLKVSFRKQLTEMYYDSLYSLPNSLVDCRQIYPYSAIL